MLRPERLRALRDTFSRCERMVTDCVLADPQTAIGESLATFAARAGVSEPTVIRHCRALGCVGWSDFKLRLAQALASGAWAEPQRLRAGDDTAAVVAKVFDAALAALSRARANLDTASLERASTLLATARRIECYGHGASGLLVLEAQQKFFRLGVAVVAYSDAHVHAMSAALLKPGDAVLALSRSGRSPELLGSAQRARAAGADLVAVTVAGSPLAALASIAVTLPPPLADDDTAPCGSRHVMLAVLDVLAHAVALQRPQEPSPARPGRPAAHEE